MATNPRSSTSWRPSMRREEVIELVDAELDKLGVSRNTRSLRKIPSRVELELIIPPGTRHKVEFRTGITSLELEEKMLILKKDLALASEHQTDIEDAIKESVA